jgi:methylmalonyl-CoA mutase N-terminal domain/subunit
VDPSIERDQIVRLEAFRASRDGQTARKALDRLSQDAREDRNLMPAILEAVSHRATLGEIVTELKTVFGEHASRG